MTHEQLQAAQRAALSLGFNITSEVAAAVFQAMTAAAPAPSAEVEAVEVLTTFVIPSCEKSYGFGYVDGTCSVDLRGYRNHLEEILDSLPQEPLMTVAQHQRIVAAKDAEIAQLNEALDRWPHIRDGLKAQVSELRAQLAAQQAAKDVEIARLGELVTHLKGARDAYGQNAIDAAATARGLRAQLAAQQAAVPVGWKLVPLEPAPEMVQAAILEWKKSPVWYCQYSAAYRAMVEAAPAAPQQGVIAAEGWANGFPPAGELCEARIPHHTSTGIDMIWCEVEVIAHTIIKGVVYSWVKEPGEDGGYYAPLMLSFRRIDARLSADRSAQGEQSNG